MQAPAAPSRRGSDAQPPRALQRRGSVATMRRRLGGSELEPQGPRIVGDHYQLGVEIGRGGFGVVFGALDLRSGRSVAIKQVALAELDADALLPIESEVRLLKKLSHENIVTYFDTIRTPSHLYIVLEYMENGSLAQFMKKFGSFSEPLVAMYIAQVLRGLAYLHEQGVLHRDVKGANILTTKDGLVKLADFGVAVKLNETTQNKANSVVGSPYWMAPEVIEMSGTSFASDVWSVGCTIIELLTTKPPYFDLQPMAALFRIVQDDHPPLPERISPALQDFIMKCFMKEPRLRSSAAELLQHPWISQIPRNKVEQSSQLVAQNVTSSHDRDAVLNTIKLYKNKQQSTEDEAKGGVDDEEEDVENWDDEFGVESEPRPLSLLGNKEPLDEQGLKSAEDLVPPRGLLSPASSAFQLSKEDANALLDDDMWDDEDDISTNASLKIATMKSEDERKTWSGSALIPVEKRLSKLKTFREEDEDDDLQFADVDEDKLMRAAVARRQLKRSPSSFDPECVLDRFKEDDKFDDIFSDDEDDSQLQLRRLYPSEGPVESSDVLFDDEELDFEYSSIRDNHQKATARVMELLALLDPSMDDQVILDACTNLQELLESNSVLRRDLMSQPGVIPNIMEALEMKKLDVLCAVLRVVNTIIQDNKRFQENLALVGLVPVIIRLTRRHAPDRLLPSLLQYSDDTDGPAEDISAKYVRLEAAKFVRQSCRTSSLTLQMFVACGGLPVLVDFLTVDASRPIKDQKELLRIALEGIFSVFRLQTIPKNDICRLFVKAGLLHKFITVFREIFAHCYPLKTPDGDDDTSDSDDDNNDNDRQQSTLLRKPWSVQEVDQMCDVLLVFSQGDAVVKEHMCDGAVLEGILQALLVFVRQSEGFADEDLVVAIVVKLLKCIRNLSMEPVTLDKLDRAGTITTLVRLLNQEGDLVSTSKRREVENLILQAMFYLCRLNRSRQTHAAQAGVIPSLIHVVQSASPLKQFALPLLCDFAHASPTSRAHLWACDAVPVFLDMLDDKYWQVDAIKSLSIWLVHDTEKMENALLERDPGNLFKIVQFFRLAQETELEILLEPLLDILVRSVRLNQSLGRSALFVSELLVKLRMASKAIVRKNLLKMLKCIFENHTSPVQFVVEHDLYPIVFLLAQDANSMILVKEIASQLLQAILVATGVC